MRKHLFLTLAILALVTGLAIPASAGGWASVTLTGQQEQPVLGVPWTISFLVKQHDRTPVNVDRAYVTATHRGTSETIRADATQVGDVGNYSVTLTFPRAGEWKWTITPYPFQESSFAILTVLANADATPTADPLDATPVAATPIAATGPTVEISAIGDDHGNWMFTPGDIAITVGTTVVWSNYSSAPHTVSSLSLDFNDSGYLAPGESYQQVFTKPGIYAFHCDPHPWMTGTIEVRQ